MRILTLEEHRTRIENLRRVTEDTKKCTRDWRIHDYLPGQVTYYLGDYPPRNMIISFLSLMPRTVSD